MKTRKLRTWITAAFIMPALLISPVVFAAEKGGKADLKPKVTVAVDGLTCPFCAYGLEKRIKKLSAVRESTINIKKGTVELFPKKGQHIEIDAVKDAVKSGGFTPREIRVALVGKLVEWNGETVLSIVSTDEKGQKDETKYLLKANEQLKKLKASMKSPDESLFIAGKVVKETPDKHTDHPYTIIIEKYLALSKKG
ncbi:MAG: cation transporter [Candidatus Poribacteria bacterium]|nr:cation transporter [Candidatus Poribacteria bacterium]